MTYSNNKSFTMYTDAKGIGYLTERGLAELAGVSHQAVNQFFSKGVNLHLIKTAVIHTPGGLQGVNLIPDDVAFDYILSKAFKGNQTAIATTRTVGTAGLRVFINTETGYSRAVKELEDLYATLRGGHAFIHVEWQEKQEAKGLTPKQIADEYKRIFDSVCGEGSWAVFSAYGGAAVDNVHPRFLDKIVKQLTEV